MYGNGLCRLKIFRVSVTCAEGSRGKFMKVDKDKYKKNSNNFFYCFQYFLSWFSWLMVWSNYKTRLRISHQVLLIFHGMKWPIWHGFIQNISINTAYSLPFEWKLQNDVATQQNKPHSYIWFVINTVKMENSGTTLKMFSIFSANPAWFTTYIHYAQL